MALPDSCCDFVMTRLMTFLFLVPPSALAAESRHSLFCFFGFFFSSVFTLQANMSTRTKSPLVSLNDILRRASPAVPPRAGGKLRFSRKSKNASVCCGLKKLHSFEGLCEFCWSWPPSCRAQPSDAAYTMWICFSRARHPLRTPHC